MSRRGRHGRNPGPHPHAHRPRPAAGAPAPRAELRPDAPLAVDASVAAAAPLRPPEHEASGELRTESHAASAGQEAVGAPAGDPEAAHLRPRSTGERRPSGVRDGAAASAPVSSAPVPGTPPSANDDAADARPACTVAQLRRFIKSRPWLPMHELRRRFGITGQDDDVSPIRVGQQTLFVGLPPAEGRILAELLGAGDVGFELSVDPITPIVIGVYPMRPVPRT